MNRRYRSNECCTRHVFSFQAQQLQWLSPSGGKWAWILPGLYVSYQSSLLILIRLNIWVLFRVFRLTEKLSVLVCWNTIFPYHFLLDLLWLIKGRLCNLKVCYCYFNSCGKRLLRRSLCQRGVGCRKSLKVLKVEVKDILACVGHISIKIMLLINREWSEQRINWEKLAFWAYQTIIGPRPLESASEIYKYVCQSNFYDKMHLQNLLLRYVSKLLHIKRVCLVIALTHTRIFSKKSSERMDSQVVYQALYSISRYPKVFAKDPRQVQLMS